MYKRESTKRRESMLCDELQRHSVPAEMYNGKEICGVFAYYDADDVDALLAEKDKEIARQNTEIIEAVKTMKYQEEEIVQLKQKLEDVQASAYADSVDAGAENWMLRRALWLTRAERASDKARIFYFAETCGVKLNIDGYSNKEKGHSRMCTARWWRLTWLKVELLCRTKAEEYK